MAWEPAERVQKNSAGQYRALIGGEWVPVDRAQKNSAGEYRVERGAAVEPPTPGQSAEVAALAAPGGNWFGKALSGTSVTIPEQFKQQFRGVKRSAIDALPDSLDKPPPGVPYEEVDRYGGPRGYYEAMYGLKSDEELKEAKAAIQEKLTAESKESEAKIQAATPQDLSFMQRGLRSGVESLVTNAPGLVGSVLTGSAIPALAAAGAQTGFNSYEDARAAGKDAMDALAYGGVDAAIEVATEFLPTKYLTKLFRADSLKGIKSEIAKFAAGEIAGEEVATLTQSLNAAAHGLDDQLNDPNLTIGEKINVQLERQALTAISTIVAGGTQAAVATGLAYARQPSSLQELTPEQTVGVIDQQLAGNQTRLAEIERQLKLQGALSNEEIRSLNQEAKALDQEITTLNQIRKQYAPKKEGEEIEDKEGDATVEKGETKDKSVKLKGNVTIPPADQVPATPAVEGLNELEQRALDTLRLFGDEQNADDWKNRLKGLFNIDSKGAGILLSRLKGVGQISGQVKGLRTLIQTPETTTAATTTPPIDTTTTPPPVDTTTTPPIDTATTTPPVDTTTTPPPSGMGTDVEISDNIPMGTLGTAPLTDPANPLYQKGAEALKEAAMGRKSVNVPAIMKATGLASEPARQLMDAYEQAGLVSKAVKGKRKYLGELPKRELRARTTSQKAVAGAGAAGVGTSVRQQGVPGGGTTESTESAGLAGTGESSTTATTGKAGVQPALDRKVADQMQNAAREMLRNGAITNADYNKIIIDTNLAVNPVDDTGEPLTELPDFKPTGKIFNAGLKRLMEIKAGTAKPIVEEKLELPDEEAEKAGKKRERATTSKQAREFEKFSKSVAQTEGVKVAAEEGGEKELTGKVAERGAETTAAETETEAAPKKRGRPKKSTPIVREARITNEEAARLLRSIGGLSQMLEEMERVRETTEATEKAQKEAPQQTKKALDRKDLAEALNGKSVLEALDIIIESSDAPVYREIAKHIRSIMAYMLDSNTVVGMPIIVSPRMENGVRGEATLSSQADTTRRSGVLNMGVQIKLNSKTLDYATVLHEIVHGALLPLVTFGRAARAVGVVNTLTKAVEMYEKIGDNIGKDLMHVIRNRNQYSALRGMIEDAQLKNIFTRDKNGRITGYNVDEIYAWALSDENFQTLLRMRPYANRNIFSTAYEAVVGGISRMLGFKPDMQSALGQILSVTTNLANTANAVREIRENKPTMTKIAALSWDEVVRREARKFKAPPRKPQTPDEMYDESQRQLEEAAGGKKGLLTRAKEFLKGQTLVKYARDIQNYRYVLKDLQNAMEMTQSIIYETVGTKGFNNFYDRMVGASGLTKRVMLSRVIPRFTQLETTVKDYAKKSGMPYDRALAKLDKILKALHIGERRRTKFMMFAPLDNVKKNFSVTLADGSTKQVSAAALREYVWNLLHTNIKFNTDAERQAWYKIVDGYRTQLMDITDVNNPNNYLDVNGTSLADTITGTPKMKPGKRSIDPNAKEYDVLGTYYPREIDELLNDYNNDPNKVEFDKALDIIRDIQDETVKIDEEAKYWTQGVSNIRQFYGWQHYVALTGKAAPIETEEDDVLELSSPRYSAEYKGQIATGFKGATQESQNALIATQIAATRAAMRLGLRDSRQAIRNALVQGFIAGKPKETIKFEDRAKGLDPVKYQGNRIFINYNADGSIEVWELTNKDQRNAIRKEFEADDPSNLFQKSLEAVGKVSGTISQFFTRYNPAFAFKNFVRDTFSYAGVFANLGPKKMAEYVGNVSVDVARIGLIKAGKISYLWNKGRLSDIEKLAAKDPRFYRPAFEYLNNGGESVFVQQFVKLSRLKDLVERHNIADADSKAKSFKEILDATVDTWAASFELTARVSAYRIRKAEIMAANPTISDEAAQVAAAAWTKEIQNFEAVGDKVRRISKLYYFFRPGATGGVRAMEMLRPLFTYDVNKLLQALPDKIKKDPAKIRAAEIKLRNDRKNTLLSSMAMMGMGYALWMMMYGMAGDDDEDRNIVASDNQGMWTRNIRIPLSAFGLGEKDEFFQIPWGLGFSSISAMGAQIAAFTHVPKMSGAEFLSNLSQIAANSYVPIQPVQFNPFDPTEGAKSVPRNMLIAFTFPIAPSLLRTPLEYLINVNSLGQQIYQAQPSKYGDAYVAVERLPEFYNDLSKWMDKLTNGAIDEGPEFWYYLISNTVAGLGNLVSDSYSLSLTLLGEKEFEPKRDTVFFSSFFGRRPSPDAKDYEHAKYDIEQMQAELRKLDSLVATDPNNTRAEKYRDKYPGIDGLIEVYKDNKVAVDKFREVSKMTRAGRAGDLSVRERKERVKELNEEMNQLKIQMIQEYNDYKESWKED